MAWQDDFPKVWDLVSALPGWLRELPARTLYGVVRTRHQPVVVEIGTYLGKSAVLLGKAAEQVDGRVYCVDPFDGRASEHYTVPRGYASHFDFWQNAVSSACLTNVTPVCGISTDAAAAWQLPIDVLYIDGDHSEAAVRADYAAWTPFLKPGGILCMDDVNAPGPGRVARELVIGHWPNHLIVADKLLCAVKHGDLR